MADRASRAASAVSSCRRHGGSAVPTSVHTGVRRTVAHAGIRELEIRLEAAEAGTKLRDDTIADLRRRLDESERERREQAVRLAAAQERIAALLTDQRAAPPAPARRGWWSWRRR